MSSIPTEKDWRGGWATRWVERIEGSGRDDLGLDGEHAYRVFFGKSHSEAVEMFHEEPLCRQEDLMWMPIACFRYYVNAYIEYLRSESARDDADGSNAFFGMIQFRLHEIRQLDNPLKSEIVDTIGFLGNNQKWFDATPAIYGSFTEKADELIRKLDTRRVDGTMR